MTDTKDKILVAAEELIAEHGFEVATTRMIAKACGVNIAMINYYFGGKEQLLEKLIEMRLATFAGKVEEVSAASGSAYQKMITIIDFYVDKLGGEVGRGRIIIRELDGMQRPRLAGMILESISKNRQKVAGIIRDGIASGEFREADVELTTMTIYSVIYQFSHNPFYTNMLIGDKTSTERFLDPEFHVRIKAFLKDLVANQLLPHDKK
ncbi:MAG: TetR/AcrR family transcriptional regulator [Bacteroidota bacterium]